MTDKERTLLLKLAEYIVGSARTRPEPPVSTGSLLFVVHEVLEEAGLER